VNCSQVGQIFSENAGGGFSPKWETAYGSARVTGFKTVSTTKADYSVEENCDPLNPDLSVGGSM
jgi:hypothetical protein